MANYVIPEGMYLKGHRVKIHPTESQKQFISKCINADFYIYNWALEEENNQYGKWKDGESEKRFLTRYDLDKKFTELRKTTPFLQEIPHNSGRSAIRKVVDGFNKFFKGVNNHPKYRSKKRCKLSYKTRNDRAFFEDNMLRIEGLPKGELITTKFHTGLNKNNNPIMYNCTVSIDSCGNYWFSYKTLEEKPSQLYFEERAIPESDVIGIDLNVKKRFVLSNGKSFCAPNMKKEFKRLARYQRKCQKDRDRRYKQERNNPEIKGSPLSKRSVKRINKCKKQSKHIKNINENFVQTTTKQIINMHPKAVVMENLSVRKMLKRHHVAKEIYHATFYRNREVMEYKCNMYDIPFILAEKGFKSSQICSRCGAIMNDKYRKDRLFICTSCGFTIDRDDNASLNLKNIAYIAV